MNRRQPGLWPDPPTRAELDSRPPDVGDRVWCAGYAYVVAHRNDDGSVGIAYDGRAQPQQPQQIGNRR